MKNKRNVNLIGVKRKTYLLHKQTTFVIVLNVFCLFLLPVVVFSQSLAPPQSLQATVSDNSIILSWSAPAEGDTTVPETEPNNTFADADLLEFGQIARGTIDPAGDGDFWKFDGTAGQSIIIDVDAQVNGSDLDAIIGLIIDEDRNGDGVPDILAVNGDYGGSRDSRIEYTLTESRSYYILLINYSENQGGPSYFYDMSLSLSGSSTSVAMSIMPPISRESNFDRSRFSAVDLARMTADLRASFSGIKGNSSDDTLAGKGFRSTNAVLQGYNIYRSTSTPVQVKPQNLINNVDANTTSYTDNDVQSGITYFYVVTTVYDEGESEPSNEVSAQVNGEPLEPPQNLQATVSGSSVILEWEPAVGDTIPETEPNNTFKNADLLDFGEIARGTIDPAGDGDFWKFDGTAGQSIIIDVDAEVHGSSLDAVIFLAINEDADGDSIPDLIDANDDFDGLDSRIDTTLPKNQTYFILIVDYSLIDDNIPNRGGPNYFYDMSLSTSPSTSNVTLMASAVHSSVTNIDRSNKSHYHPRELKDKLPALFFNIRNNVTTSYLDNIARSNSMSLNATLQAYNIYRFISTPVQITPQNRIGNVDHSTTTFTDNNVQSGITYYYVVTAVYDEGESEASNEASAMIKEDIPICPTASSPQVVGNEFWVDINVGDTDNPVSNLFGVSFVFNFTQTNFIDVVTPYSSNVIPGDFLGNDVIFVQSVDEATGKVSIGISRKAGQGGVNGYGTVVRVKLIANSDTPDGTQVLYSITNLAANEPNGMSINLNPCDLIVTISGVIVWPGDTNNDGVVNQADVLPIGLCWNQTGPPRQNASSAWIGQPATPWANQSCTFADANGDGIVNQADVLPIGINWNRTHTINILALNKTVILNKPTGASFSITWDETVDPGDEFFIYIFANDVSNLFGVSFELVYDPTDFIDPQSVEYGGIENLLGDDLVTVDTIDKVAAKVSIGLTRKSGAGGINGSGLISRIRMTMSDNARIGEDTTWLSIENVRANDPDGNSFEFDVTNAILVSLVTDVEVALNNVIPDEFALHQNFPNPFNPETTIQYHLPKDFQVKLIIYNLTGQRVVTLVDEQQVAGIYTVTWNGKDDSGRNVSSGVYLYRIETQDFVQTRKLTLVR